jgi:tetratricopeptide (TPR) repeat protein
MKPRIRKKPTLENNQEGFVKNTNIFEQWTKTGKEDIASNSSTYDDSLSLQSLNANYSEDTVAAIQWAAKFMGTITVEKLSDRPWAKTYKLVDEAGYAYLKILPPAMRSAITSMTEVSAQFPKNMPTIIASDSKKGLVLQKDHGGKDLSRSAGEMERTKILQTYASIQARCTAQNIGSATLPTVNLATLIEDLLKFLSPSEDLSTISGAKVHADYFLSKKACRRYASLIKKRQSVLQIFINKASALPDTINHCDLRPSNAAADAMGNTILYDWDEAVAGPAGLSLHALFSGCISVIAVMHKDPLFIDARSLQQPQRELTSYVDTLVASGYSDHQTLLESLSSAAVAGMIHYLISASRFPRNSKRYKRAIRKNLTKRLSALLDACDFCSITTATRVIKFAEGYSVDGRDSRAVRLLTEHLRAQPEDAEAHFSLGKLLRRSDRLSDSLQAFRNCVEINPQHVEGHAQLGKFYTQSGEYNHAKRHYRCALSVGEDSRITRALARTNDLERAVTEAERSGVVPTISFTKTELGSGRMAEDTLNAAEKLFRKHGVLHIKNVFDVALLKNCHAEFLNDYQAYLVNTEHEDALRIGDKRFQITLKMQEPFNSPALYGNELVLPLMKRLLGRQCILGCFTSAMSLPGSLDQRSHKDHKHLFHDDPEKTTLPSFAVTMMVPLVDLDEHVGTTRLKKGTHRLSSEESKAFPYQTPLVKRGDCYLMDYRASHQGQANHSDTPRPIVSLVYQRPWFRDYINFKNQPSLSITAKEFNSIPKPLKSLLAWTTEPGPLRDAEKD